jgi:hypothetical protein
MKAWTILAADATCGYCGALIPASTAALVLEGPGLPRRLRCPKHAGEPIGVSGWVEAPAATPDPPADPPGAWDLTMRRPRARAGRVAPLRKPKRLEDIAKDLPFDGRAAAAGKDE